MAKSKIPWEKQPIKELHDLIRTTRLNLLYYKRLLQRQTVINNVVEFSISLTTPGSAVAALLLWESGIPKVIWGVLVAITALFSVAKPFMNLSGNIIKLEKTISGYQLQESDLLILLGKVKRIDAYTDDHRNEFQEIQARKKDLVKETEMWIEDKRLKLECEEEVRSDYYDFYVPGGNNAG